LGFPTVLPANHSPHFALEQNKTHRLLSTNTAMKRSQAVISSSLFE